MKGPKPPTFVILLMAVVWLIGACQPLVSPAPELPERVLFIGDSFTYWNEGVDTHMEPLAASADPPANIEASSITRGGLDLAKLWVTRPTLEEIQEGDWDVVVLQEDVSMLGYDEQEFHEYARKFDNEIKKADAQTVLYMPWEYRRNPTLTTEDIARAYGNIGAELGVRVAPVGLAWARSIQERPDLDLYDFDGLHPSMAGTYLTLCVLYATLFGQSPVGLSYRPTEMTEEEVTFLQRIAWETVVDYQAQS